MPPNTPSTSAANPAPPVTATSSPPRSSRAAAPRMRSASATSSSSPRSLNVLMRTPALPSSE